jgi:hypothetical protein
MSLMSYAVTSAHATVTVTVSGPLSANEWQDLLRGVQGLTQAVTARSVDQAVRPARPALGGPYEYVMQGPKPQANYGIDVLEDEKARVFYPKGYTEAHPRNAMHTWVKVPNVAMVLYECGHGDCNAYIEITKKGAA